MLRRLKLSYNCSYYNEIGLELAADSTEMELDSFWFDTSIFESFHAIVVSMRV